MPYVYSTLSTDVCYNDFKPSNGREPNFVERKVLIRGGANVATKHLVTPKGVMTKVSDEELAFLEKDEVFQLHVKNGHITVSGREANPDKVAGGMTDKDASAPLTPADYKDGDRPKTTEKKAAA